ncbi:MINT protein, partial [Atractosteus spatula]|nr:MINT protein [Atractosteus spatula]
MVRETRHLWVGNLPENVREEKIIEHFKRREPGNTRDASCYSCRSRASLRLGSRRGASRSDPASPREPRGLLCRGFGCGRDRAPCEPPFSSGGPAGLTLAGVLESRAPLGLGERCLLMRLKSPGRGALMITGAGGETGRVAQQPALGFRGLAVSVSRVLEPRAWTGCQSGGSRPWGRGGGAGRERRAPGDGRGSGLRLRHPPARPRARCAFAPQPLRQVCQFTCGGASPPSALEGASGTWPASPGPAGPLRVGSETSSGVVRAGALGQGPCGSRPQQLEHIWRRQRLQARRTEFFPGLVRGGGRLAPAFTRALFAGVPRLLRRGADRTAPLCPGLTWEAQARKRYGRVESVKILPKRGSEGGVAAFVDFVDIKSAQKAHNSVNKMGDRDLRTDYNEPGTIPSAARGLDDTLSIGSRGRDVSGFRGGAGGPVYGPPTSLHSREGRYERRLEGDPDQPRQARVASGGSVETGRVSMLQACVCGRGSLSPWRTQGRERRAPGDGRGSGLRLRHPPARPRARCAFAPQPLRQVCQFTCGGASPPSALEGASGTWPASPGPAGPLRVGSETSSGVVRAGALGQGPCGSRPQQLEHIWRRQRLQARRTEFFPGLVRGGGRLAPAFTRALFAGVPRLLRRGADRTAPLCPGLTWEAQARKRYGRVESVKILPKRGSEGGVAAFVDFVDIKSAQKAHNSVNKMGDRDLRTDYNEPGTIPSAARGLDDTLSIGSRGRDVSGEPLDPKAEDLPRSSSLDCTSGPRGRYGSGRPLLLLGCTGILWDCAGLHALGEPGLRSVGRMYELRSGVGVRDRTCLWIVRSMARVSDRREDVLGLWVLFCCSGGARVRGHAGTPGGGAVKTGRRAGGRPQEDGLVFVLRHSRTLEHAQFVTGGWLWDSVRRLEVREGLGGLRVRADTVCKCCSLVASPVNLCAALQCLSRQLRERALMPSARWGQSAQMWPAQPVAARPVHLAGRAGTTHASRTCPLGLLLKIVLSTTHTGVYTSLLRQPPYTGSPLALGQLLALTGGLQTDYK